MSIILEPYLNFNDGQCEAALKLYQSIFGGKLDIMRFSDAPMPCAEEHKDRVMHCYFKSDSISFMASDCMPEESTMTVGSNISMSLNFTSEDEQTRVFNALSNGAKITMPLGDTFWNARFGMLTDKFGVQWMLNYNKAPQNM